MRQKRNEELTHRGKRMVAAEAYLKEHYRTTGISEMAKHLGVGYETVRRWVKKFGLGGKRLSADEKERIRQRIADVYPDGDKESLQRLADEFGITLSYLRALAHRFGIRRSADVISRQWTAVGLMNRGCRKYGQEVVEWLREHYPTMSSKECARQLGIKQRSVSYLAYRYGIKVNRDYTNSTMKAAEAYHRQQERTAAYKEPTVTERPERGAMPYNCWQHQHDDDIRRDFSDKLTADLADKYDVNYYTLSRRASRLGIAKSEAFLRSRMAKGGSSNKGCKKNKRTEALDAYMKARFSNTSNAELATLFGVDVKTVRRWARRLGLVKSEDFMRHSRSKKRGYYTPEQKQWRQQRAAEAWRDGDEDTIARVAAELGVKIKTIKAMSYEAGVHRSEEKARETWEAGIRRITKYTPEIIAAIAEYYPNHTNEECAQKFGISRGVINQLAHKHGMKKTKEHKHRVYSRK